MLRFCHQDPAWCQRNIIIVHFSDEQRAANVDEPKRADDTAAVLYHCFHSVFRQYHLPGVDDYSYLAHTMLTTVGFSEEQLTLSSLLPLSDTANFTEASLAQPYQRLAKERIAHLTQRGEEVNDCPALASPLPWKVLRVEMEHHQESDLSRGRTQHVYERRCGRLTR